jgi:nicotinamidase-related amidase
MDDLEINKDKTAIVVIDLQKGIVSRPGIAPHLADVVVSNASKLVEIFRENKMPVFLVHVSPTNETALKPVSDKPMSMRDLPKDWAQFVPSMTPKSTDIVITKQQWGAFYGTDLDLQLRRRGINTIVLCGIATNIGVESTARFAYEYGYNQIFVEDAMATWSANDHNTTVNSIFKTLGRVRSTNEILDCFK